MLPNNCCCSNPSVYPANWDKAGASCKKKWYIQYYFYDPEKSPEGKLFIVKRGINIFKNVTERQDAVRFAKKYLLAKLKDEGYNPITKVSTPPPKAEEEQYEIPEDTLFLDALQKAYERLNVDPHFLENIKSTLKYFSKSARALGYDILPIGKVKRKHIRFTLEHCEKIKDTWSNNCFNNYRRDIQLLYKELIRTETVDCNLVNDIEKKVVIKKAKKEIPIELRKEIHKHVAEKNNAKPFLRFIHIFFHSGARIKELLSIKGCDVDIANARFKIIIKKGSLYIEKWKPINNSGYLYWVYAVMNCGPDDYVFHRGLKPGNSGKPIRADQVTRRWKRHIKDRMGIDHNLYNLKHQNLTEIVDVALEKAQREAAEAAGHTTTKMVDSIYDLKSQQRKEDLLRMQERKFA